MAQTVQNSIRAIITLKIISNSERTHPLPNENVEKRRQERAASDTNATVVVNKGGGIQVELR